MPWLGPPTSKYGPAIGTWPKGCCSNVWRSWTIWPAVGADVCKERALVFLHWGHLEMLRNLHKAIHAYGESHRLYQESGHDWEAIMARSGDWPSPTASPETATGSSNCCKGAGRAGEVRRSAQFGQGSRKLSLQPIYWIGRIWTPRWKPPNWVCNYIAKAAIR